MSEIPEELLVRLHTVALCSDRQYASSVALDAFNLLKTLKDRLDREVDDLYDEPLLDGTDVAHPAWWRGNDSGIYSACKILSKVLTTGVAPITSFEPLNELAEKIAALAEKEGMR